MGFLPSHPLGSTPGWREPEPSRTQGSYLLFCSRGGLGRETRRAWAQGHQQHQVSFHLYKDSLTPEHINTVNDRERSWDSRPAPPLRLPSPPLPSGPIFFLFCAFSLLSVPLCLLSVLPLLSLLPLYLVLVSSFSPFSSPPALSFLLLQSPQQLYTH